VDCLVHVIGEIKSVDPVSNPQAPHSQMSLNSSQTGQQDPVQYCFHNGNGKDLVSLVQVRFFLRGFLSFFLSFLGFEDPT